jgi:hypothetical protein
LGTLDAKLKHQVGVKQVTSALKWPFTKAEVQDLTQAIAREMRLLQLALTIDYEYVFSLFPRRIAPRRWGTNYMPQYLIYVVSYYEKLSRGR